MKMNYGGVAVTMSAADFLRQVEETFANPCPPPVRDASHQADRQKAAAEAAIRKRLAPEVAHQVAVDREVESRMRDQMAAQMAGLKAGPSEEQVDAVRKHLAPAPVEEADEQPGFTERVAAKMQS